MYADVADSLCFIHHSTRCQVGAREAKRLFGLAKTCKGWLRSQLDGLRDERKKLREELKTVTSPRSKGSLRRKIDAVRITVNKLGSDYVFSFFFFQASYQIDNYKAFRQSCQYQSEDKEQSNEDFDDYDDYLDLSDLVRNN